MNLTISVTPETERLLISHAAKQGKDLASYLSDAVQAQIVAPLLSAEIHDRGRGPEIKGTRITVYDVLDFQKLGWQPEAIATHLRVTTAQVEKAIEYIANNKTDVEHAYQRMLARSQQGNPPEIRKKLEESRAKLLARRDTLRKGK